MAFTDAETSHPLKALLQLYLTTDAHAVASLPYVLESLDTNALLPSPHLPKWIARMNALIYSKDAGARWAGFCISLRTAELSKSLMMELAQGWVTAAVPVLFRAEPTPVMKASIRLLNHIFTAAVSTPEFQRQIATPNIPKFSSALLQLGEKQSDQELNVLILQTLNNLILLYPTLHRTLHGAISSHTLRHLNGSAPNPTPRQLLTAASSLYAVLHVTGGKVNAGTLWRKSLDETITFMTTAFYGLRTAFSSPAHRQPVFNENPSLITQLCIDRLKCGSAVMSKLLSAPLSRPVQVPVGSLFQLIIKLLGCTLEDQKMAHAEPAIYAAEIATVPLIWDIGCDLIKYLTQCVTVHITPYLGRLLSYINFHLEQQLSPLQRLHFLRCSHTLLLHCHSGQNTLPITRLAKAALPSLVAVLGDQNAESQNNRAMNGSESRKGKKRARGYEGDEIFRVGNEVIYSNDIEAKILLMTVDVLSLATNNHSLPIAVHSLTARVFLSVLMKLQQISPSSLLNDVSVYHYLRIQMEQICVKLSTSNLSDMSGNLPLIINCVNTSCQSRQIADLDLLLHPRLPPLLRNTPHVDHISLFRSEESLEECELRDENMLTTPQANVSLSDTLPTLSSVLAAPEISKSTPTVSIAPDVVATQSLQDAFETPSVLPTTSLPKPSDPSSSSSVTLATQDYDATIRAAAESMSKKSQPVEAILKKPEVKAADRGIELDEDVPAIDMNSDSDDED